MEGARRIADRLATDDLPAAGYGVPVIGQFSSWIGCKVSPPWGVWVDLAALCIAPTG